MRGPLQEFEGDNYERPNQPWLCGLDDGSPCPAGPGKRGKCPGATACHPIRDREHWICNRATARGGTCESGPSQAGECCIVYQCKPLRSLRAQRGRFVFACLVATLGGLCLMLSSDWRNEMIAPGPLSSHHAALLKQGQEARRCASCHAAGDQTFGQWMQQAFDLELAKPSQTVLCLECHQKQIEPDAALWAHNVDPQLLLASADPSLQRQLDPTQKLACSACHREHHGATHDLTWMSDNACQACHQEQYQSFAKDHPEFKNWPTQRRTRIAFDHAAHQRKHFSKDKQEFLCAQCHVQNAQGDFQQTLDYEATCAQCHDSKIETSWNAGIAMFALPMIDTKLLTDEGHDIGQWPEAAGDEFDGSLPPLTKLLLVADPRAARALVLLGSDFDFFDVDPDDSEQLQAAAVLVTATKQLLYDLLNQGQAALRQRVEKVLDRQLTQEEFSTLAARLSPENLAIITDRWLTQLNSEMSGEMSDELSDDKMSDNKATETNAPLIDAPEQDRQATRDRVEAGGWLHDELTLSIRYRPTGHADPWVTAWIDVLAESTNGPHAALTKPLLKQMMLPTSAGQCGSCHSVDRLDVPDNASFPNNLGRCEVQWFAKRAVDDPPLFTKFSHVPHLIQTQLADCQACHQINPLANVMETYQGDSPDTYQSGFQPLTKQSCAECHTPQAAGDSCLQCHKYHVGGLLYVPKLRESSTVPGR